MKMLQYMIDEYMYEEACCCEYTCN